MITLGQIKNSSVANVAGANVGSPEFVAYVNDAIRILMDKNSNRGSRGWWGTVVPIIGTAYNSCFVWPSGISCVLAVKSCNEVLQVANYWYSFLPSEPTHNEWATNWKGNSVVEFEGETCLFRSIAAAPTLIHALSDSAADNGQTITLYGTGANGQSLTETLTFGSAPTTANAFATVSNVRKDVTAGQITLYAYDAVNGIGEAMARYSGGDINPKFLYSNLRHKQSPMPITALVKLGFKAVASDSDILLIDSIDAIKSMVQSLRAREAGDHTSAEVHEKVAVRRLVDQVNSRFPLEQTVVRVRTLGLRDFNSITQHNL